MPQDKRVSNMATGAGSHAQAQAAGTEVEIRDNDLATPAVIDVQTVSADRTLSLYLGVTKPLRECGMVGSVAGAWHQWKRRDDRGGG